MASDYVCPFCDHVMGLNYSTFQTELIQFRSSSYSDDRDKDYSIKVSLYRCPHCGVVSTVANYNGDKLPEKTVPIYPTSNAIQFPDYIPKQIRSDYEEACAIVSLSPKASATLSRRCLQGMIRDYWQIAGKRNLAQEIDAISDKVSPPTRSALDALRGLGNIGAHMERDIDLIIDIDPGEAEKLLRLIEHLLKEWYITRHDTETLFSDVVTIQSEKDALRKPE